MKKYFSILLITVIAFSCKKKENLQKSTWTVNGETFTAVADASVGKAISIISTLSTNNKNYFDLSFSLGWLPKDETKWLVVNQNPNQNPEVATLYFYFNGTYYYVSSNDTAYLTSSINNGKAKYVLDSTWYINSNNAADSALVTAIILEP